MKLIKGSIMNISHLKDTCKNKYKMTNYCFYNENFNKEFSIINRDITLKDREKIIKNQLINELNNPNSLKLNRSLKHIDINNKTMVKFYIKNVQKNQKAEDLMNRLIIEEKLRKASIKKMEKNKHLFKSATIPFLLYSIFIGFFYLFYYTTKEFEIINWNEIFYSLLEIEVKDNNMKKSYSL